MLRDAPFAELFTKPFYYIMQVNQRENCVDVYSLDLALRMLATPLVLLKELFSSGHPMNALLVDLYCFDSDGKDLGDLLCP